MWLLREKYSSVESEAFHADAKRLADGEPLAYLIGSIPFLGCKIWLDSHPLIPRPETEFWVEKAIPEIKNVSGAKVLDLCAGSGCIGVAIAHHVPSAMVHFAEIDIRHLPTIGKNLKENQIACTDYRIWQSDLFANISDQYDFILSNPPYIDPVLDRTTKSVKNHEPHHALYGGHGGLEFIEAIIMGAPTFLTSNGQLWLEHEPEQVPTIHKLASQFGFNVATHKDQYNLLRFSVLTLINVSK